MVRIVRLHTCYVYNCVTICSDVLCRYLGQKTMCDVSLVCRDGRVPCHQVVLAALSPLLRSLLRSLDTGDIEDRVTIVLPDLTVQEVDTFLANIYEG